MLKGIAMDTFLKGDIIEVDIDAITGNIRIYKLESEQPKTERQKICDEIIEGLNSHANMFGGYGIIEIKRLINQIRYRT